MSSVGFGFVTLSFPLRCVFVDHRENTVDCRCFSMSVCGSLCADWEVLEATEDVPRVCQLPAQNSVELSMRWRFWLGLSIGGSDTLWGVAASKSEVFIYRYGKRRSNLPAHVFRVKEGDKVILGQCRKFGDCKGLLHLSTKPYTKECQLRRSVVSVHDLSICSVAVKILLAMPGTSIARFRKNDQTKLGRKCTLLRHKYLQKMEEGVEPKTEAHRWSVFSLPLFCAVKKSVGLVHMQWVLC